MNTEIIRKALALGSAIKTHNSLRLREAKDSCTRALAALDAAVEVPEGQAEMARRLLWIAFSWNDHNCEAAHIEARKEAARHGINNFDQANEWLSGNKGEQE